MTATEREELAAAVEQLQCGDEFSPTWKCGYNSAIADAAALIRSNGRDDGDEPVAAEWLESIGFQRDGNYGMVLRFRKCYGEDTAVFSLACTDVANLPDCTWEIWVKSIELEREGGMLPCEPQTRRQVRDLCRALGVELRESSAGSVDGAGASTGAGGSEQ